LRTWNHPAGDGFAIRNAFVTSTVVQHDVTPRSASPASWACRRRSLRIYLRLGRRDWSWTLEAWKWT